MQSSPLLRAPAAARPAWPAAVTLFFLGWILVYANRTVVSPLLPVLEARWGLSREQLGLLSSAFFVTYTAFQIPMGLLADRLRRKSVLVAGFILHGVGAVLSGVAPGAGAFLTARVATGAAQSSFYSTNNAILMAAMPPARRALGAAIAFAGQPFGVVAGYMAAGWFLGPGPDGWRGPFLALGAITVALGTAMGLWLREAEREPAPGAPTGAATPPAGAQPGAVRGAAAELRIPALWLYFVASIMTMYGFFVLITWLPYYLERGRGYSPDAARWLATVMPFVSLPFVFLWSRLSDRWQRRRGILLVLIPAGGLGLAGVIGLPGTAGLLVALVLYGVAGKPVMDPIFTAAIGDLTHPATRATVFSVGNFVTTTAMVVAPWLTGRLADVTGGFAAGFYLAAALQAVALLAVWLVRQR